MLSSLRPLIIVIGLMNEGGNEPRAEGGTIIDPGLHPTPIISLCNISFLIGGTDPGGLFRPIDTAWAAIRAGRPDEAAAAIRAGIAAAPDDRTLARLGAALDRLRRPARDPDTKSLRATLPAGMAAARSDHLLLFHATTEARARERLDLLERVVATYLLAMTALGFDLALPDERLVAVELPRHADYLSFLAAEGAGVFSTTTGYFHPTRRVVATFDPTQGSIGPELARQLAGLDRRAVAVGTAAHETIHQCVDATGLGTGTGSLPHWLHEGLAMQFEAAPGGVWAGFGQIQPIRLADWRRSAGTHRLRALVRDEGFARGYRQARYAEAWALVYYMVREHPARFAAFLDRLRLPRDDDRPAADRFEADFRAVFGDDLAAVERAWIAAIDGLDDRR